jgi:hypothetical protein
MVRTAQWIHENLPPDAVLAIHDIGAVGYFTKNPLIDLAGLVTPDVVGFIRDEPRLDEYLTSTDAEFLVTFPSWYQQLIEGRPVVFQAGLVEFPFSDNMSVYRWR